MTGGRKNEQFDIVAQAQMIVDEYEKKYFKCLGEAVLKERKERSVRRTVFVSLFVIIAVAAALIKVLI